MQFKGVWRDYQAQVLDQMEGHLAVDGRLHVVAAPGAGKTVLGLEIVRRLDRPALVFAPTVAIRDQWEQRLVPLFLDVRPGPEEVSHDLDAPRRLTLTTYQALDGFRRTESLDGLMDALNATGPLTLVLDEAHHLRREWWNSLARLAAGLADVRIVALTATPPYDASYAEWARYESLCGPIDLEIGAPALVRNGDLCPHQDHVVFSAPTGDALRLLEARRRGIAALHQELRSDAELLDGLERHPWLTDPEAHVEAILEAPEMLSAVLVLLASAGRKPPAAPLRLLGVPRRRIPRPSQIWLERLINGLVHTHADVFDLPPARLKALRTRLHKLGLIEGGRVRLCESRAIFRLMASSLGKLDSIGEIACAEDASLGAALRMVVLSDHIRAEELPSAPDATFRPAKLGVVPIFEHLRRSRVAESRLGVLTGSLVIVPRSALAELHAAAYGQGLEAGAIRALDLAGCPGHVRIEATGAGRARLVHVVTALFTSGAIRILVGTQSLLGEGWDAPAVNSLVLASNTASFMLSNQMRGRALRAVADDPAKVANIWHLATVEPSAGGLLATVAERLEWGALADEEAETLSEAALLARRFLAFEGVSNGESTLIESGLGRLGLDLSQAPQQMNRRTMEAASDRAAIARRWRASLGDGAARARVRETAAPTYAPRVLSWRDTLQALVWSGVSAAIGAVGDIVLDGSEGASLMIVGGAAFVAGLPALTQALGLLWRNGSVEGSLVQVGAVVLESLAYAGLVSEAEARSGRFKVRTSLDGRKDVVLFGVSRGVERQVMQAIAEVLGPVENPRFLLVRHSRLGWRRREDFHAVPAALAARKAWAERFARLWKAKVGSSQLVFTRSPGGRRVLLRARAKSLAAGFQRRVERRSAWL